MKEFPEKWCIKCTIDTAQTIYNWLDLNKQTGTVYSGNLSDGDINSFVQYPMYKECHQADYVSEGYTEITFEEFQQCILRIEPIKVVEENYSYLIPILKKLKIK